MGEKLNQLRAMVYKNYVYKKRHWFTSLITIFMAVPISLLPILNVILY